MFALIVLGMALELVDLSLLKTLWFRSSDVNGRISMVIMLIVSQIGKYLNIFFFLPHFFGDIGS